jgi:hypothetical protein
MAMRERTARSNTERERERERERWVESAVESALSVTEVVGPSEGCGPHTGYYDAAASSMTWQSSPLLSSLLLDALLCSKVETPIHDSIRELVSWECKEHGVKS